jgi:hypothetical protein
MWFLSQNIIILNQNSQSDESSFDPHNYYPYGLRFMQ